MLPTLSLADVVAAFDRLFIAADDRFVVRRSQASRAVAAALGLPWSPDLGRLVLHAASGAGARAVVIRAACYRGLRPRSLKIEEALRRSRALLAAAKRTAAPDPAMVAAAQQLREKQ